MKVVAEERTDREDKNLRKRGKEWIEGRRKRIEEGTDGKRIKGGTGGLTRGGMKDDRSRNEETDGLRDRVMVLEM